MIPQNYPIVPLLIEHLAHTEGNGDENGGDTGESLPQRILNVQDVERPALLEIYLKEMVARVLRIEQAHLDTETPINMLGLDSMLAIELKHRLEQGIGKGPSVVELLQGASIAQLTQGLAAQLQQADRDVSVETEVTEENLEQLLTLVDEDTVAQLLAEMEQTPSEQNQETVTTTLKGTL